MLLGSRRVTIRCLSRKPYRCLLEEHYLATVLSVVRRCQAAFSLGKATANDGGRSNDVSNSNWRLTVEGGAVPVIMPSRSGSAFTSATFGLQVCTRITCQKKPIDS